MILNYYSRITTNVILIDFQYKHHHCRQTVKLTAKQNFTV